jgi:hypothetical protein
MDRGDVLPSIAEGLFELCRDSCELDVRELGYPVVSVDDSETVRLDIDLLKKQFGLE